MADILTNYVKFLRGTTNAYNALSSKDPDTLYFISEKDQKVGKLYLGDILVAGNVTADGTSVMDSLGELTDVNLEGLADKKVLGYDETTGKWKPMAIEDIFTMPEIEMLEVFVGASASKDGTKGLVPAPKIGDEGKYLRGDGTWATIETSSATQIFEADVEAGADHIAAITTAVGENTVLQNGDIAIVKELINGNKRQYTSYVYEDENWKAMDGNYNAENVFFDEDITITQTVGNVTATNGNGSIPAAGKNIRQVFEALWTKEDLSLSIDTPSVSFTLSNGGAATGEVGSPITLPKATLSISDIGSYEYGSKDKNGATYGKTDTGIKFTKLRAAFGSTASSAAEGAYTEQKDVSLTSGSVEYVAKNTQVTEPLFLDTEKSYAFSYEATYVNVSEPRKPVTNLGNFIDASGAATTEYADGTKALEGNTLKGSSSWKATGYRKWFWGYKTTDAALADPTAISSAEARGLQKNGTSAPGSYTVPAGTKQVYFVFPAGKKSSLSIANKSALGAPVACEKVASGVQVADYRGTTKNDAGEDVVNNPIAYDLWYVNLDAAFSGDAELTLTWA